VDWSSRESDGVAQRSKEEQAEHDEVVRLIAEARFPHESCRVVTNPGTQRHHGISYVTSSGKRGVLYPDIVSLLEADAKLVAAGEVETQSSVTPAALPHWRLFAQNAPHFYLYVPVDAATVASGLLREIENVWLRTYCFDADGGIVVSDV
jgi:hypothetical protein